MIKTITLSLTLLLLPLLVFADGFGYPGGITLGVTTPAGSNGAPANFALGVDANGHVTTNTATSGGGSNPTGNGAGLTNVNAANIGGIYSTNTFYIDGPQSGFPGNDTTPVNGNQYATLSGATLAHPVGGFFIVGQGTNYIAPSIKTAYPILNNATLIGVPGAILVGTNAPTDGNVPDHSYIVVSNSCTVQNLIFTNVAFEWTGNNFITITGADFENLVFHNENSIDVLSPIGWVNSTFKNIWASSGGDLLAVCEGGCDIEACTLIENAGDPGAADVGWSGAANGWNNRFKNCVIMMTNATSSFAEAPAYVICSSNAIGGGIPYSAPPGTVCGNEIDNCVLIGEGQASILVAATDDKDVGYYNTGTGYYFYTNLTTAFTSPNAPLAQPANRTQGYYGPNYYANLVRISTGLDIASNTWNLVIATNGMDNWANRITESNHVPVDIFNSNGVPIINYLGTPAGGIIP